jgi:hypothetical protein
MAGRSGAMRALAAIATRSRAAFVREIRLGETPDFGAAAILMRTALRDGYGPSLRSRLAMVAPQPPERSPKCEGPGS